MSFGYSAAKICNRIHEGKEIVHCIRCKLTKRFLFFSLFTVKCSSIPYSVSVRNFPSTVPEPLVASLQPLSNRDSMRLPSEKSIKLFRQIKVLSSQKQQCPHHKWIRTIKEPKLFFLYPWHDIYRRDINKPILEWIRTPPGAKTSLPVL